MKQEIWKPDEYITIKIESQTKGIDWSKFDSQNIYYFPFFELLFFMLIFIGLVGSLSE